jgi:hypothetical protein
MNVENIRRLAKERGKTVVLYKERLISKSRTLHLDGLKGNVYVFSVHYCQNVLYEFTIKVKKKNNRLALYGKVPREMHDFVMNFTHLCKNSNNVTDVVYETACRYNVLLSDSVLLYVSCTLNKCGYLYFE